jgi:Ca-activated chloride channel family protein
MKHAARLSALLVTLAVIILWGGIAPGAIFGRTAYAPASETDDRTLSPYFFVKSGDASVDQLPLKETSAHVSISGVIADVSVTQVYKNQGTKTLEALYVFPASTRAAVYGMRMTIGARTIEAKIEKREEARRAYEQARDEGKSASLLEQQRPNVFQMNVANILPGDEVKVELKYTELLVPTEGVYEFVYPTVVGPRYSNRQDSAAAPWERWVQNPYLREGEAPTAAFNIHAVVTAGMAIRELACPSHKVSVSYEGPSVAKIDLDKSEKYGGNRDYVLRYRLDGDRIQSGVLLYEGEKENFFLVTMQPPKSMKKTGVLDREYIFVVDVSGSMWGYPLNISKKLVKDLLGGLRPSDLFNVILFSGGSSIMAEQSVPASPENIRKAVSLIDRQEGGGGTELLPALKQALSLKKRERYSRSIVVATDGFVEVEEEVFDLIRNNLGNANIFAFGIGTSVNRHIIEGMAEVGMGEPFIVARPEEAPSKAARFRAVIESPVLTGINLTFEGFAAYDVEPPHIPDVLSERPVTVFGKYRGKARGSITLTGLSGDGNYSESIDVAKVRPMDGNAALRYLWARHRIALLSDYNKLRSDDARTREVIDLGLRYNLLTAYTSFVAIDTEVRAKGGKPVSVKQPLPLPQGVSDYAVGGIVAGGGSLPALAYAPSPGMSMGGGYGPRAVARMPKKTLAYDARGAAPPGNSGENAREQAVQVQTGKGKGAAIRMITLGEIAVSGGLSKEAVSTVVRAQAQTLEKYYQGSGSAVRLVVRLTIGRDGTVRAVKVLRGAADFKKDIADQIRKWRFPATGDGKEASATITLLVGA